MKNQITGAQCPVPSTCFMREAVRQANKALTHDDVPVGAVIARGGRIIARGRNMVQKNRDVTAHAEIVAIRAAAKKLGAKFLDDCEIYVTLEPCAMCATAISFARIGRVVFAARDDKGGGILSGARVFDTAPHLWKPKIGRAAEFENESAELLKEFFKNKRQYPK
ncbi:MAG: nucleoside deaminase [Alphaproteobacteria bacterium]|nr:nucleoside deaminase [Alphaproteobacteria bacterium]